ncbi:MAG: AraC family transcriptional regulator ligand-binding domain-containing protein [Bacteroidota bacterium]
MGQITALFASKVLGIVDEHVDKDAMLRSIGIEPGEPVDPALMVSADEYYAFLERLAASDGNPTTLSLRGGGAMRCSDYGAFGLAFKSATTLLGSYERAARYARVLTSVSTYTHEQAENGMYVHLNRAGERRLGMRISNEATIAAITAISREVSTAPFTPLAVYFKHPEPVHVRDHEIYFECPVYFDTDRDALLVASTSLHTRNKVGDESIARFFDSHLEATLATFEDETALDKQVCNQVSRALSEGVPAISDVAGQLGMSGRTLQRRLSETGHTFQALVDTARRQLAERLLQQTDYSLAEIAFMTGYAEQSAFTRAFMRWAGQTPRSYRLNPQKK